MRIARTRAPALAAPQALPCRRASRGGPHRLRPSLRPRHLRGRGGGPAHAELRLGALARSPLASLPSVARHLPGSNAPRIAISECTALVSARHPRIRRQDAQCHSPGVAFVGAVVPTCSSWSMTVAMVIVGGGGRISPWRDSRHREGIRHTWFLFGILSTPVGQFEPDRTIKHYDDGVSSRSLDVSSAHSSVFSMSSGLAPLVQVGW